MSVRTHLNRALRHIERSYDVHNRIEVSRSALLHNVQVFRRQTGLQIIPVLKGNAYGHGIEQVAMALKSERFPYVAVDGYFEALQVRSFNSRQPLLVMGMIKPNNFSKLRLRGLAFVVQDEVTLRALGALHKKIKIHLELNTGMNRYGIKPDELDHYINLIKHHPKLRLEGVMTHLADPDGEDMSTIDNAVERFDTAVEKILSNGLTPTIFHSTQTGGGLRAKSRYANSMRLGIGLYGINPYPAGHPLHDKINLHPALALISTITKVQELKKGEKVSYNYTFTAPKPMRIGILPLGYHEGVNRELSNVGMVKVGEQFQPIVGRVCMNHTIISLEGTNATAGDDAVVYSNRRQDKNSIDGIAEAHGLFSYGLLTGLSPDVRRYLRK